MPDLWQRYEVKWTFLTKLCGAVPADPDLQKKWLEGRAPKNKPPSAKSIDELAQEVMATTEEAEEPSVHVLQRVEGGLVVRAATIRAHIKDCARVLSSLTGKVEGERSFAVRVINGCYLPSELYWVPILSAVTGRQFHEPDGTFDRAIHAVTPRGPISALRTTEYVENAILTFPLLVLKTRTGKTVVSEEDLGMLFQYGGTHGYYGERGAGEGRYVAEMRAVEK